MTDFKKWFVGNWAYIMSAMAGILLVISYLWYRLVSLPAGYNLNEWIIHNNLIHKTYNFHYFWHNALFAPYYLILVIPQAIDRYGLFTIRSVGSAFGLISVLLFFYISWRWWGNLIAALGTILFTSSLWFLQLSRNGGADILYVVAALALVLLGFVIRNKKEHETKTLFSALLVLLMFYIPGMIWFILAASIMQREFLVKEFKKLPTQVKLILPLVTLIFISPLIISILINHSQFKSFLGLPQIFSFKLFIHNLIYWPIIIFVRDYSNNIFTLGHLPILSIFTNVMFILGVYWIWVKRQLDRFYLLGATLLISWLLYALGGPVSIYLSLPFIFCISITGMAFILNQWFSVFPKNPVARSVGISLLILAVISVSLFHTEEYFIAWPETMNTITVYSAHKS